MTCCTTEILTMADGERRVVVSEVCPEHRERDLL